MNDAQRATYDDLGGADFFDRLTAGFYRRIETDDLLRPMYPPGDLGPAQRRLRLFLEQYWGGPTTYSDERGHPRLRMRHAPYAVTPAARNRWLQLMGESLAECDVAEPGRTQLWGYVVHAANFLLNADDAPPTN